MKFRELPLAGAFLIELQPIADDRGFFCRTFCREEFAAHGLEPLVEQASISHNTQPWTLRGMHFQVSPHAETKLVKVLRGSILDIIVDIRPDSPTWLRHVAVPLDGRKQEMLYVPKGFAHGFVTLEADTDVSYVMSTTYSAAASRGFLWNDPALQLPWPPCTPLISPKDAAAPCFSPELVLPLS